MNSKIFPPNIHLFAYSLNKLTENHSYSITTLEQENTEQHKSEFIWDKCDEIIYKILESDSFKVKTLLVDENPLFPFTNLVSKQKLNLQNIFEQPENIQITIDKKIDSYDIHDYYPITIKNNKQTEGDIYALHLYNSYAFGFNIYPSPEKKRRRLPVEQIQLLNLNPDNCLIFQEDDNQFFLGQTLLITAKIRGKNQNKSLEYLKNNIADKYLDAIFPKNYIKPPFNRAGKLLGRPIFEYGIFRQLDFNYRHILVWLMFDEKDEKNIVEKCYSRLLDLFLFRTKIVHAYKETREHTKLARKKYWEIESEIDNIQKKSYNKKGELNLKKLNELIIKLNTMSVAYANMLRDIEDHQSTIVDNTRNYNDKVKELRSTFPGESLSFLVFFGERTCRSFQEQVAAELGYFQHGIDLVDNVVDAFRGQVAIEQTNRERQLQVTILSVSFGMTAAGNIVSSYEVGVGGSSQKLEPLNLESFLKNFNGYHFGYSLMISIFAGLAVWLIAWRLFNLIFKEKELVNESKQNKRFKCLKWLGIRRQKQKSTSENKQYNS